jgi:alpha-mannosidase
VRALASAGLLSFALSQPIAQETFKKVDQPTPDLTKTPTLYLMGYAHLDTEWRWSYPQTIREFLRNTLVDNFTLFDKYPNYIFNFTGSNRYRLMKEYFPVEYQRMKEYVKQGRWYPAGSSVEEGDVNSPSEESLLRQFLYGNEYFRDEFGIASNEYMLPDCFGFPASLPTILAHAGLKGFSTQKLTWGSAVGIPFNVGEWEGPDGSKILSALNPGAYDSNITDDVSHNGYWLNRVNKDGQQSGVYTDYRYYGTGDVGGSPTEGSVREVERSLIGGGPLQVRSSRASDMFDALLSTPHAGLPVYKGDLELTGHSAGSLSSEAEQKRWNHENEQLADSAERASVAADWLGAAPYDQARITDAWLRFLPGQFHDLMAGTALPKAYEYAWNDQVIAMNESAGVLQNAAGGVARALDTRSNGIPLVVYNPLSIDREDPVEATVHFPQGGPPAVQIGGPDGRGYPAQVIARHGNALDIVFLARVPSIGFAAFTVVPAAQPQTGSLTRTLTVSQHELENSHYRVTLNADGDIASIFDKTANREMLSSPARLAFQHENPVQWPAWNMDWNDQRQPPRDYVHGPATVRIVESGPARVALQVERSTGGSRFIQTIRLAAGSASDRIEITGNVAWKTKETALKATFPLSVSNPQATYNWGPGTVMRGNDEPKKFEVGSHNWFDLTDKDGSYGVSVLTSAKYGSDKPDDNTLRLTLIYTPGTMGGYQDQGTQDIGTQEFIYGLYGHKGAWQSRTPWQSERINQPLVAFVVPPHTGPAGRSLSLLKVSDPAVEIGALKKAERGSEIIVRFNELTGAAHTGVRAAGALKIVSAREVDGQERHLGPATVENGALIFDMAPYRPRAFALKVAAPAVRLAPPVSSPVSLAGLANRAALMEIRHAEPPVATPKSERSARAEIPSEVIPARLASNGTVFQVASGAPYVSCSGQKVALPAGTNRTVSVLACSMDGDQQAEFAAGPRRYNVTVQAYNGYVGQWDNRIWGGTVPDMAYDFPNPCVGLVPGYIKRESIAWYCDHTRLAGGSVDPYAFCYLFRYDFHVPDSARSLTLPNAPDIRVYAVSVGTNPNADAVPAHPLYDVLERHGDTAPTIQPAGGSFSDAHQITLDPPLYYSGPLHYTTDGSAPTVNSPVYSGPIWLTHSADVRAAALEPGGRLGEVTSAHLEIRDTTPPTLTSAYGVVSTPILVARFSEPVERASAETASNYQVPGVGAIQEARLAADQQTVTLRGTQPIGTSGSALQVSGVRDLSGNAIAASAQIALDILRPAYSLAEAHTFDGVQDGLTYASVPDLPTAAGAPWTISMLVYLDKQPQDLSIIGGFGSTRGFASGRAPYLINYNNSIHFWGANVDVDAPVPLDIHKWQMLTATFDGSTLTLYKNGAPIASQSVQLANAPSAINLAPRPAWQYGHRFAGKVRDFTIWNRALDAVSIKALMAQADLR